MNAPEEILYRPRGPYRSNHLGAHSSTEVGGFGVFRDRVPFFRFPDGRRIDLRASLRDPYEQIYVRRFEQRQSVDVFALVDFSASMGFIGACDKAALGLGICEGLAYSATSIGDRFGLIGCDRAIRAHLSLAPTRSKSSALYATARLRRERFDGAGSDGFLAAAAALGASRKLVCLISDFRWPELLIRRVFDLLSLHDTAPIVIVDSMEETPPAWGLVELVDSESGKRGLWAMRPRLRAQWIERERTRRAELSRIAADRCRPPIFVRDVFDPGFVSSMLMAA
jgi:uncharacterized protein (DUF58 family)